MFSLDGTRIPTMGYNGMWAQRDRGCVGWWDAQRGTDPSTLAGRRRLSEKEAFGPSREGLAGCEGKLPADKGGSV